MKVQKLVKFVLISAIILSGFVAGIFYLYKSSYHTIAYHSFGPSFGGEQLQASEIGILAVDYETKNVVWEISAERYGIRKGYSAGVVNNVLWIVENPHTSQNDVSKLWIFNENGEFMWQRSFKEFIVTSNLNLTAEGYLTVNLLGNRAYPVECYPVSCKIDSPQAKDPNMLLALNISDGKEVWNHNMNQYFNDPSQNWSSRVSFDQSKVYIYTRDNSYAEVLDSASGQTKSSTLSVYVDHTYNLNIDYANKEISYVKEYTQESLWLLDQNNELYKQVFSAGLVLKNIKPLQTVFLVDSFLNNTTLIIDRKNGKVLASIDNKLLTITTPFTMQDDILIVEKEALEDIGDLFALNIKTGKILWTSEYTEFETPDGELPVIKNNILNARRRTLDDFYSTESIKLNIYTGKDVK